MGDNATPSSISSKQSKVLADQYKENREMVQKEMIDELTQSMTKMNMGAKNLPPRHPPRNPILNNQDDGNPVFGSRVNRRDANGAPIQSGRSQGP